ncbi:D-glycero-alpha-D-manno-heptose 7-phosphate kinase [subsurface metagenome]
MIITQTPLRISFFGGGTDFRDYYMKNGGGAVLSTAIDKYIFAIIKERFDEKIYINYSKKEIVDEVGEIEHDLVRESMRKTGVEKGVEITTLADIPSEGSGLGSSSSVTVGLLNLFYLYQAKSQSAEKLAEEACQIETDVLKKPIGKQDQYAAAFGNLNIIRFNPDDTISVEPLVVEERIKHALEANLMLIYTGMTRSSTEILSQQRKNIMNRTKVLSEMRDMVDEGREYLLKGHLHDFGRLLDRGWELKKSLANRITNPKIEQMYETALKAGVLGGKVCGAGGGGFLLLNCPFGKQDKVRDALGNPQELPFHFERDGTKAIFNIRR